MRSNDYYNKMYVSVTVAVATLLYLVAVLFSSVGIIKAYQEDENAFTPNYDKSYRDVLLLNSPVVKTGESNEEYSLASIDYDMSTLYLDWSGIETERKRIELEAVKSKAPTKTSTAKSMSTFVLPDLSDTSFKGYMCMHKVTDTTSRQWEFLHSSKFHLITDEYGIMKYDNYYVVAMGSYYTNYKVGSTFRVTLDSGITFDVITGDEKSDDDTDEERMYRPKGDGRGEVIEFIIACGEDGEACNQYDTMNAKNRGLGNLSSLGFQGNVTKIEKLNDNIVMNELNKERL